MFSVFGFVIILTFVSSKDLPSYFPKCRLHDEFLGKCIIKSSETLRPYLRKGIPELGLPSIDPLIISEMSLSQGTDAVNIKIQLSNLTFHGFDTYKLERLTYDKKTFHGQVFISFGNISVESSYELEGKVLALPITGKGQARGFLGSSTATVDSTGELVTRKGEEYYNPLTAKITLDIGDVDMKFDGILNDNKELSEATQQVLRDNSKEIIKEMLPVIEKASEELLLKISKAISKNVPYNKIFIIEEQK